MGEGNGTVIVNGNTVTSLNIPGEITVLPLAISANGTVLGRAINFTSTYFSQTQGTVTLYPNAPGFLNGVNDNGQFVGTTFDGQKNFIYDAKTGSVTNISDGNSSFLKAINDNGAVLDLTRNGTFIYKAGLFTPLVLPNGCSAKAMNDIGTVVGNCFGAGSGSGFIDKNGFISYVNYTAAGNGDVFYTQLSGINESAKSLAVLATFPSLPA